MRSGRTLHLEAQNRERIKKYWKRKVEQTYELNPQNMSNNFPQTANAIFSSPIDDISIPSQNDHTPNIHFQLEQSTLRSPNIVRINSLIMGDRQRRTSSSRRKRKIEVVSKSTRPVTPAKVVPPPLCECFTLFKRQEKKDMNRSEEQGKRMSVWETGIKVEQRTIKKVVSCERKKNPPSTKYPSSDSKRTNIESLSPIPYHH